MIETLLVSQHLHYVLTWLRKSGSGILIISQRYLWFAKFLRLHSKRHLPLYVDTDVYTGKHITLSVDFCLMTHKKRKHHQTETQRKQERKPEDKAEKKGDIKRKDENKNNNKGKKNQHFQIRQLSYMIKNSGD